MSLPVFVWPLRVYYEDTDASGVAYHANYLRWFERARTEWLRALGFEQTRLHDELGIVFTVASLDVRYRRPARLDDEVTVEVRVPVVRAASLQFEQRLLRSVDGAVLAELSAKVGCVAAPGFRPTALPEALRAAVAAATGTA
ncbi:tol-pal system-associated acyl-CoA thioesterase [Sinimarinibacterium thermocellulolyticum]|uniref:Tol-pal system-associated acyl-CoA thioesterase n=1 Tax=Sinimarinibacterium thermocellulolyticum TaxID=3170016 RepID=A0ABV2A892_9GAMM